MAAIEGLLLLVMAVVGALCAVQDIRKSIVPNCWIAAGIMIAAVLQTIDQLFFAREYGDGGWRTWRSATRWRS